MLGCFPWLQVFNLLQAAWQYFKRYLYFYQLSLDAPTGNGTHAWQAMGQSCWKVTEQLVSSWGDEGWAHGRRRVGLWRGHDWLWGVLWIAVECTAVDPAASTEWRCSVGLHPPSVRTVGSGAKGTGHGIRRWGVSLGPGTGRSVSLNHCFSSWRHEMKMVNRSAL